MRRCDIIVVGRSHGSRPPSRPGPRDGHDRIGIQPGNSTRPAHRHLGDAPPHRLCGPDRPVHRPGPSARAPRHAAPAGRDLLGMRRVPPSLLALGAKLPWQTSAAVPCLARLRGPRRVPARALHRLGLGVRWHRERARFLRRRRGAGPGGDRRAHLPPRAARTCARSGPDGRRGPWDRAGARRRPALRSAWLSLHLRRGGPARNGRESPSEAAVRAGARGGRRRGVVRASGRLAGRARRPRRPPPADCVLPVRVRLLDPDAGPPAPARRRAPGERIAGRAARGDSRRRGSSAARTGVGASIASRV